MTKIEKLRAEIIGLEEAVYTTATQYNTAEEELATAEEELAAAEEEL